MGDVTTVPSDPGRFDRRRAGVLLASNHGTFLAMATSVVIAVVLYPHDHRGTVVWLVIRLTLSVGMVVAVVFLFVGVIEVISILIRPLTLAIRLYGNIFAGENVLHTMSGMGGFIGSVLAPFPFYFMELLVGLLQAVVFTLLCTVYVQLSTTHDDHGHEEHH